RTDGRLHRARGRARRTDRAAEGRRSHPHRRRSAHARAPRRRRRARAPPHRVAAARGRTAERRAREVRQGRRSGAPRRRHALGPARRARPNAVNAAVNAPRSERGGEWTVYVANADSAEIAVLALDRSSGALREVDRFATDGKGMPLAVRPDRRVLYASIRSEPLRVLSLAIDPASGRLSPIGSAPLPASMCWISTDATGRFLLSASYGSSVVAVSPIGDDGVARDARQVVATEEKAHALQVAPDNRFALATCLGGGVVRQFRFDATTAASTTTTRRRGARGRARDRATSSSIHTRRSCT